MVIVLDTNVFVSALIGPRGSSRKVLRSCLQGELTPLMGASLLAEYEALLSRKRLFAGSGLDALEREEVLNALLSRCRWTRVYFLWRPNLPDEADNHLVELAVAGGAEVIVTKNLRDLRRAELHFPHIRVLPPEELIEELDR